MRWKFVVSDTSIIDFSKGLRQTYFVEDDTEISFMNVTDGRLYVLKLIVKPGKTITWKNDNGIILKFAEGTKYEENESEEDDTVYLGFYAEQVKDDPPEFILNCLAFSNNFEEIEEE